MYTDALFCTTETNTIFYVNYTAIKVNLKKKEKTSQRFKMAPSKHCQLHESLLRILRILFHKNQRHCLK